MATLEPKPGFDWGRVAWSVPDGRIVPLCSYCSGPIGEDDVPLMLWKPDGSMAHFCDTCMSVWWGFDRGADDPDDDDPASTYGA